MKLLKTHWTEIHGINIEEKRKAAHKYKRECRNDIIIKTIGTKLYIKLQ